VLTFANIAHPARWESMQINLSTLSDDEIDILLWLDKAHRQVVEARKALEGVLSGRRREYQQVKEGLCITP